MLGPVGRSIAADAPEATESLQVAVMALSRHHTRACTEWQAARQVDYAARRGARLGVFPEMFCFSRSELEQMGAVGGCWDSTPIGVTHVADRHVLPRFDLQLAGCPRPLAVICCCLPLPCRYCPLPAGIRPLAATGSACAGSYPSRLAMHVEPR